MDNHIPYTYIKNQIFTHPTMAENLNDVFNFKIKDDQQIVKKLIKS